MKVFGEDRRHANRTLTSQLAISTRGDPQKPPLAHKSDVASDQQTACAPHSAARSKTVPGILQSDLVGTPTSIRSAFLDIPPRAPPSIPPLPKAANDVSEISEPIGETNITLQESTLEDSKTIEPPRKSSPTYGPSKPSSELTAVSIPSRNMSTQPSSDTMKDDSIDGHPGKEIITRSKGKQVNCIVRKNGKFCRSVKPLDGLPGERVIILDPKKNTKKTSEKKYTDCKPLIPPPVH